MEAADVDASMISPYTTPKLASERPLTYVYRPLTWREFARDRNAVSMALEDNMSTAAEEVVAVQDMLQDATESVSLAPAKAKVRLIRSALRAAARTLRDDGNEDDETEDAEEEREASE